MPFDVTRSTLPKDASEHDHQAALFAWADLAKATMPELAMLAAVPNGGLRHKAVAGRLKREGVKAGYPDVLLDVARRPWHGLRIEMKAADRGSLSAHQRDWIARLSAQGYLALVCHGWDEARVAVERYLALPKWAEIAGDD